MPGSFSRLEMLPPFAYYESLPQVNTCDFGPISDNAYTGMTVVASGAVTRVIGRRDSYLTSAVPDVPGQGRGSDGESRSLYTG